ncbi:hypothetical protein PL79_011050 [Burkholderia sp. USMB20]|nr:hypothetical protein PL79_011050 [Burkholderia sp. USMB20]
MRHGLPSPWVAGCTDYACCRGAGTLAGEKCRNAGSSGRGCCTFAGAARRTASLCALGQE